LKDVGMTRILSATAASLELPLRVVPLWSFSRVSDGAAGASYADPQARLYLRLEG
jgi:hypothetical protein